MDKVITLKQAIDISRRLREEEKTVVLAGGCFDILHKGHKIFLKKAKAQGDYLFVPLESDKNVARLKGNNRPINNQEVRAANLTNCKSVDYIILLPSLVSNKDYFALTKKLAPDIIAITQGDPKQAEKEMQGKVVVVTKYLSNFSTTKILQNV